MFETATLTYESKSKRVWGTFAGVTGQALLVTCAVIAPMLSPAVLPHGASVITIAAPGPPPPPPRGDVFKPKTSRTTRLFHEPTLRFIPDKPQIITDDVSDAAAGPQVPGGIPNGSDAGVRGGSLIDAVLSSARPPAPVTHPPDPPAPPVTRPTATIVKPPRISVVELARPISRVDPIYPPIAKQMRVSGVVELQGVLGTDGRIHELKVLRGHPLLVRAAVDAVSQWIYAPTILNGQAVEVVAPIIVTFKLN